MPIIAINITIVTIITIGLRGVNTVDINTKTRNTAASVSIFASFITFPWLL